MIDMIDLNLLDLAEPRDRARLLDHLATLSALIGALGDGRPEPAPQRNPALVAGDSGVEWPRLANEEWPGAHQSAFASAAFQQAFKPGGTARVYVCGSSGLRGCASEIDVPLRKVGATEDCDVRNRIADASADRYGGCYLGAGGLVEEPGYDNYVATPVALTRGLSPASPVAFEARALKVTLPATMTFVQFEAALQAQTRAVSLFAWANSAAGQAHFARIGVDRNRALRRTSYGFGAARRINPAEEILIFRPRRDGDRLAAAIERLILRHLGLAR
jgi:hypothetical protein